MANDDPDQLPEASKLTRTKQRWAEEGRFLTGRTARPDAERLPPGQHLVCDWPVLDLGEQPEIALDTWRLAIDGAVTRPEILDWATFQSLPQSAKTSDIHCVTSWSRYDNGWTGVSTRDILDRVMPKVQARFVLLRSYDGYTTNITIEDFASEDAILAHSWEGKPLTRAHGGPVRLVVPHLYFWKSAKWLKRIEFLTRDAPGFWEVNGYHNRADPWQEQRYSDD
ncbi:MAG: sulfite oxidase-like oxidoreductase [Hyphomicrobium sp.]|nr:sulfite oxidase-like oxidoreductase [Hyphomicrobium sp.]